MGITLHECRLYVTRAQSAPGQANDRCPAVLMIPDKLID